MAKESWEVRFRQQIACSICSGYLVMPTKLAECLHTCKLIFLSFIYKHLNVLKHSNFVLVCRNCILNHLENVRSCPKCVLSNKVYHRDIDRPHLARSLVPDITLEEIIKQVLPEALQECIIETWYTSRFLTPPVRRIAHLTSELKSLNYCDSNEYVSIHLNTAEALNFSGSMLVPANSNINSVRKAIAKKLRSTCSQYSGKNSYKKVSSQIKYFLVKTKSSSSLHSLQITLSYEDQKLEDDLTMIVIFVHYHKYKV